MESKDTVYPWKWEEATVSQVAGEGVTSLPEGPPPRGNVVSICAVLPLRGTTGYKRSAVTIKLYGL